MSTPRPRAVQRLAWVTDRHGNRTLECAGCGARVTDSVLAHEPGCPEVTG